MNGIYQLHSFICQIHLYKVIFVLIYQFLFWYSETRGSAAPVPGQPEQLPHPLLSRSAALVHEMLLLHFQILPLLTELLLKSLLCSCNFNLRCSYHVLRCFLYYRSCSWSPYYVSCSYNLKCSYCLLSCFLALLEL